MYIHLLERCFCGNDVCWNAVRAWHGTARENTAHESTAPTQSPTTPPPAPQPAPSNTLCTCTALWFANAAKSTHMHPPHFGLRMRPHKHARHTAGTHARSHAHAQHTPRAPTGTTHTGTRTCAHQHTCTHDRTHISTHTHARTHTHSKMHCHTHAHRHHTRPSTASTTTFTSS